MGEGGYLGVWRQWTGTGSIAEHTTSGWAGWGGVGGTLVCGDSERVLAV